MDRIGGNVMDSSKIIRAGRCDKTIIRSAKKTASMTEWVTNSTVMRSAVQISRSCICNPWRVGSSKAAKGSSSSSRFGRVVKARATDVRIFMPPESSWG